MIANDPSLLRGAAIGSSEARLVALQRHHHLLAIIEGVNADLRQLSIYRWCLATIIWWLFFIQPKPLCYLSLQKVLTQVMGYTITVCL